MTDKQYQKKEIMDRLLLGLSFMGVQVAGQSRVFVKALDDLIDWHIENRETELTAVPCTIE